MNLLLVAINAKYIHSNLAVYNLKAYTEQHTALVDTTIEIGEYTINQLLDDILMDIYKKKPDLLAFSCYIWNIEYVREVIVEVHKLYPHVPIWLGGPEVSYCAKELLEEFPQITGVMKGEGEATFAEIAQYYDGNEEIKSLTEIQGVTYREDKGTIIDKPFRPIMDLSDVPFVYYDVEAFQNKIIYYESSRGCPFSCSYCLSSVDKQLRFRDVELVKQELQIFLNHKVKQVKFVDRTFNCKHSHSMEIWSYIKEHDNGVTNFHFEIAADLLNQEELDLIATMRQGLIQLEIGVQSTNEETIHEIKRVMDFSQVSEMVLKVQGMKNIHQHLDLIAGLPHEDYETFRRSFDDVYGLRPEQLQLGFLKVLKGSHMCNMKEAYGLVYKEKPPYEILYTNWLSYEDVMKLKGIEEMVEVYYNSGQFVTTIETLVQTYESPFEMYTELNAYYEEKEYSGQKHSRIARFEILYDFIQKKELGQQEVYYQTLLRDLYLRENSKTRPGFAKEYEVDKSLVRNFFEKEQEERKVLRGYEGFDKRQMSKMTHVEKLGGVHVLFDYRNRNPLTNEAATYIIEEQ